MRITRFLRRNIVEQRSDDVNEIIFLKNYKREEFYFARYPNQIHYNTISGDFKKPKISNTLRLMTA